MTAHNTIVICAAETGLFGLFWWTLFVFSSLRNNWVVSESGRKEFDAESAEEPPLPGQYAVIQKPAAKLAGLSFSSRQFAAEGVNSAAFERHTMADAAPNLSGQASEKKLVVRPTPRFDRPDTDLPDPQEIRRMASLMILSFVGMLSAGWFLSRAFAMLVFIVGGMSAVVFRIAAQSGMDVPELKLPRALKLTLPITFGLLAAIWITLRINYLTGN